MVYDILDEQGSYSLTAAGSGGGGDDNAPVQPGATVTLVLGPASGQVRGEFGAGCRHNKPWQDTSGT